MPDFSTGIGAVILAVTLCCIGIGGSYFGSSPRILYLLPIGIFIFLLYETHWYIARQTPYSAERPYISISGIGLDTVVIQPGREIEIWWDIKNSGRAPATVIEANMTGWFETDERRLPATPQHVRTEHTLKGVTIAPDGTYNATFHMTPRTNGIPIPLTQSGVELINNGTIRFYVFGYVKYRAPSGGEHSKGFIARYDPRNDQRRGMFSDCGEDHPEYQYDN